MADQSKYKATLWTAIGYSQFIGLTFGWLLGTYAKEAGTVESGLMFTFWLGSVWWIWKQARRVFWSEDYA